MDFEYVFEDPTIVVFVGDDCNIPTISDLSDWAEVLENGLVKTELMPAKINTYVGKAIVSSKNISGLKLLFDYYSKNMSKDNIKYIVVSNSCEININD